MALILIDFQKDIFTINGILKKKHYQITHQIVDIQNTYNIAKSNQMIILFVRSDYQTQKEPNDKYLTHGLKKKCYVGENRDFIDEINGYNRTG